MICDSILGNLDSFARAGTREIDAIDFQWIEARRRFLRKRSKAGRSIGLLLSVGCALRHNDVIFAADRLLIVARLLPCRAIVVRPPAALIAYELGQQHRSIEIRDDAIVMPDDDVLAAWLTRKGIAFTIETTRFDPCATDFSLSPAPVEIRDERSHVDHDRRRPLPV